jgi:hypothetical protein
VRFSKVDWSGVEWNELVGEWVSELEYYSGSFLEPLLLEAASWGMETVRKARVRGTSADGSRCQKNGEDTADWEHLSACCSESQSVN